MSKTPEVLRRPIEHGGPMGIVLTMTKGLSMDDHLVLSINERLAVVTLNGPVGSPHPGRLPQHGILPVCLVGCPSEGSLIKRR
jgi:hypothetical protein